jgi:hypothetical protein
MRRGNRGMSMIKVHYISAWKYHNETPHYVHLGYTNKMIKKETRLILTVHFPHLFDCYS